MKNFAFLLLSITFLLFSCSEDSLSGIQDTNSDGISVREKGDDGRGGDRGRESAPHVGKDILIFDNSDQFFAFYSYLDGVYQQGEEVYDATVNDILGDFASVKHRLDHDEFEKPEQAYQPYLTDPIMSTLVNEDFEVQIEDMYVVQMNNEEVVQMDITNSNGRELVKNIEKGVKVDITALPEEVFVGKDTDQKIFKRNFLCKCSVDMELVDCNTVVVSGRCRNLWNDTNGEITVSILNGPTTTTSVEGNYSFEIDLSTTGTVSLDYIGDPDCSLGSNSTGTFIFEAGSSCDPTASDTGWGWKENSGQAISFRTASYKNWWGSYEEARLYSYAWSPSGFKKNKANLGVRIEADRRSAVCGIWDQEGETKNCGNCNYKRARVHKSGYGATDPFTGQEIDNLRHCTDDVRGIYVKVKSGILVNTTANPEYDCCM